MPRKVKLDKVDKAAIGTTPWAFMAIVALVIAKCGFNVHIGWLWVLAPLWLPILLALGLGILIAGVGFVIFAVYYLLLRSGVKDCRV
jgi:hypothetical protein